MGVPGLRIPGFAALGVAGLLAAIARRRRECRDLDGEAIAQLAIAHAELDHCNPIAA
jgi:MYXO-CTERM domain-containing protein